MITKSEIEEKSREFEIHTAHVERDYVFGWLLAGIYTISGLRDILILKGGNCLRKGYFANTRFSKDLDFSVERGIDEHYVINELNIVCDYITEMSGIVFDKTRNEIAEKMSIDKEKKVYLAKLYFKDFYGNPDEITISIRLDITQFDKLYFPPDKRYLIHPYSDSTKCAAEIRCMKLEEVLATKLKCLLQRRHSFDLYDFVFSIFINKEVDVNRSQIITTFLKKTIFEPSPGVARGLLLDLPFDMFKGFWHKYIICPRHSMIDYDHAVEIFKQHINELFSGFGQQINSQLFYYPSRFRNPILDAGSQLKLMAIEYDGIRRVIEPYSLIYKRRKDGVGQEYFYAYDRTGGASSGPGIKCFLNYKIGSLEILDEKFEPQFPVELSKAGEYGEKTRFSSPLTQARRTHLKSATRRIYSGLSYIYQCTYCGKQFRKVKRESKLNPHKDKYGNNCHGRIGRLVDQKY